MRELKDFTIGSQSTILDATAKIERNRSRAVVVLKDKRVVGIISEGDIMRALLQGVDVFAPIQEFMRYDLKHLHEPDMREALHLFQLHGFSLLPVIDDDFRLLDIITLGDVLQRVVLADDVS